MVNGLLISSNKVQKFNTENNKIFEINSNRWKYKKKETGQILFLLKVYLAFKLKLTKQ